MSVRQGSFLSAEARQRFRSRIEGPVARVFIRTGLSPNALTLIGFAIAFVGAWLAAVQIWLPAALVVGFGAGFDLFDGALARATGKTSKLGAFMDSTFDRAGEAVVYVGLVIGLANLGAVAFPGGALAGPLVAAAAMAASFMVSYTRAKSESLGFSPGTGMANVGLAPREIRSVILVVGMALAVVDVRWLLGTLALIAILATVTTIQRILVVYRQSETPTNEVSK
jgi:CDP-diacylglycerol--glycerol-3-phosphate 3-phosphatidyltransferase